MFYLGKIKRTVMDKDGFDKEIAEKYLVKDAELFGDAENHLLQEFNNECEVVDLKQYTKLMEVANEHTNDDEKLFKVVIVSIFVDENTGDEKEQKYDTLFWAKDIADATKKSSEYIKAGMQDMFVHSIIKTKIVDII